MRAWLGLALALGCGSLPFASWLDEFADTAHLVAHEAAWWALVAAMLAYVRRVERRPLASIGLRRPGLAELAIGVAAGLALVVVLGAIYLAVAGDEAQLEGLLATPAWWRAISVVRAAISEEILFRGYAVERTLERTRSRAAAVALPCMVFALAHVEPWGWSHVIVAGTGGLLFALLYLWRRNLWVSIVAHLIVDGIAMI
jgi:membrane protease YdiL (CAAX protease family)